MASRFLAALPPQALVFTGELVLLVVFSGCGRGGDLGPDSSRGPVLADAASAGQRKDAPNTARIDASVGSVETGIRDTERAPDLIASPDRPGITPDRERTPDVGDARLVRDAGTPLDGAGLVPACSGICNAVTPSYPVVSSEGGKGNITMYTTEASNGGACNYGATQVLYFAAVNVNVTPGDGRGHWQAGHICGQCAEVTALTTKGPQSVVVRIMDKCPDVYCGMDLGGAAPGLIMRDSFGRYDGSWRFVSCAGHPEVSDGPTSLFVMNGANAYWSRVQVHNAPGAVVSLVWRDSQGASGELMWAYDPENSFEVPFPLMQSAATTISVSATFSDGSSATVEVAPGQLAVAKASYPMNMK